MDRVRSLRFLLPAALLLAGCRNDPFTVKHIEELNNQNRQLEDVIYEQDYQLDILKQELADVKSRADYAGPERRRPAPRRPLFDKQPPTMVPDGLEPPLIEGPEMNPAAPANPSVEVPPAVPAPSLAPETMPPRRTPPPTTPRERSPVPSVDPPVNPLPLEEPPGRPPRTDLRPPADPEPAIPTPPIPPLDPTSLRGVETLPRIEAELPPVPPGPETLPPPRGAPSRTPTIETSLEQTTPSLVQPTASEDAPPAPPAEIAPLAKPTALFLHPLYTGGEDTDGRPGDEGISVLIEPRTDAGEFVPATGKVTLALLDPALKGEEARVAKWEFDADYVRRRMKTLTTQRGILLHTVWNAGPPKNNRLKLFVRLETEAGEKLQTEREIFVALPGQLSQRWTPRTAHQDPAEIARQPSPPLGDRIIGDRDAGERDGGLTPEEKLPTQLAPLPEPKPAAVQPAVPVPTEPQPEIPTRKDRPKRGLIVPPAALGDDPQ